MSSIVKFKKEKKRNKKKRTKLKNLLKIYRFNFKDMMKEKIIKTW